MKVKVYSTENCSWCVKLKNYLKEKGIEYEDIDVSKDQEAAQEMVKKSKQMSVPVIEIDGEVIAGFDKEKINKLLNIKEE